MSHTGKKCLSTLLSIPGSKNFEAGKTGRFFFPVVSFLKRSGAFSGDDSLPFSKDSLSVGPFERNCQLLALSVLKNYSNPRHDVMRRKRKCPFQLLSHELSTKNINYKIQQIKAIKKKKRVNYCA